MIVSGDHEDSERYLMMAPCFVLLSPEEKKKKKNLFELYAK